MDAVRGGGFRKIVTYGPYRRRFLIGLFVQCIAQSTGVLVINNYQVLLYNGLGLYGYLPLLLYGVYTLWAAFLNWAGSMLVDRFGRVRMLMIGCVCFFFTLAFVFFHRNLLANSGCRSAAP